ncbi:MAG TPA: hypothetical protein VKZ69_05890, partial [Limnochordales bacterium]|nr:hypothetical protein [Limnochordales bacterium]
GGAANIDKVFDIQISSRGATGDYTTNLSAPAAGTKTVAGQDNTLAETDDAVQYGVTVTLVLVDEQQKLPGDYNTSGWDESGGLDNRRFDSLPDGDYEVEVTVTISEDV